MKNLIGKCVGLLGMVLVLKLGANIGGKSLGSISDIAKLLTAQREMLELHAAFSSYMESSGHYPRNTDELFKFFKANIQQPAEDAGKDPWGTPYWFLRPDAEILCAGPDNAYETKDDLVQGYPRNINAPVPAAGHGFRLQR